MIGWIILLGCIFLAIMISPWFWIGVGVFAIWKTYQLYFYFGRPWRRVHYPMMRAYARAAGLETGAAARNGRDFEIKRALSFLLGAAKQQWNDEKISRFIEKEYERCRRGEDVHLIEKELQRRYPKSDSSKIPEIIDAMKINFDPSDNATIVRMIIAGLIEEKYGTGARGEYIYELIIGNAK